MPRFLPSKSLALLCAALLAVLVSGCGGDGGGSRPAAAPPEDTVPQTLAGRAVKGVMINADVTLSVPGEDRQWVDVAHGSTDDTGHFLFGDLAGLGLTTDQPVRVTVESVVGSQMICDAPAGCGAVAFGEVMDVPPGLVLYSLVPGTRLDAPLSVTPLTHLAAALAMAMPARPDNASAALALARVANLFGLPADFAFQPTPDPASTDELAEADDAGRQHALLAAAFMPLDGAAPGVILEQLVEQFVALGGQLPLGDEGNQASLAGLLAAAEQVLAQVGDNPALLAWLEQSLSRWEGMDHTFAGGEGSYDEADFQRALVPLDDLDHYLTMAGIDASGGFLATQMAQVNWLYDTPQARADTEGLLHVIMETVLMSIAGAATLEPGVQIPACMPMPLTLADAPQGYAQICPPTTPGSAATLVLNGERFGQQVAVSVNVPALLGAMATGSLSFSTDALVTSSTAVGELAGSLTVGFNDTDLAALMAVLGDGNPEALEQLLATLHVSVQIQGAGSLTSTDPAVGGFQVSLNAGGELDMTRLQSGDGYVLQLVIQDGELRSPAGDALYSLVGEQALFVGIGQDAVLDTAFGFEAFGLPPMEVRAEGSLSGLGDALVALLNGGEALPAPEALLSLLALQGQATLAIPADQKLYRFTLVDNRVDVSLPDSETLALSVYLASAGGGYLYAGETLVGTLTFDWPQLGVSLHLVNGEQRHYRLGPVTDVLTPDLMTLFMNLFGGLF